MDLLSNYVGMANSSSSSIDFLGNLLDELMINASDSCIDAECAGMTEYYDEVKRQMMTPSDILMGYLVEESSILGQSSAVK